MGMAIEGDAINGTTPPWEGIDAAARVLSPTDRDRILHAMIECCAERGFEGTRVEDVLARADVRRETFDALFSGREDCAVAALQKISSEAMTSSSAAQIMEPGLLGGLLEVKALVELMAARPGYAYFSYVEARQGGTSRMNEIYESSARVLCAMIERARGPDSAGAEMPGAVRAALGGAEAVVRREIATGRAARLPRLIPDLLYSVLVPVLGRSEALRQHERIGALLAEGS
jgi:AcrR family transcriptional regulator